MASRRVPAARGEDPEQLIGRVRRELEALAAGVPFPPPRGPGIGVSGVVNGESGWVDLCGLLGLERCQLREPAERALGCPVFIGTDAHAGALADYYWGHAQGASTVVYLSSGTGIGAGLVLDGRLYRSGHRAMGELGHVPAAPDSTRSCYCGDYGCLEIEPAASP